MPTISDPEEFLTVGEVSRRTGMSISALRFYEQIGLVVPERTAGNQRRYPRHLLRRVSLVSVAKRLAIPLADVEEVFAGLPAQGAPSHADWQRASRRWKRTLEQRRRAIEQLEHELTRCIGCGCLSMKACALLNPHDALAGDGAGPRRLPRALADSAVEGPRAAEA